MTDDNDHLSDESLNALVDGEYPMRERAELMARVQADRAAADRLCGLRSLKVMVQNAYDEVPAPARQRTRRSRAFGAAAVLLLGVALLLGLWKVENPPRLDRFVVLDAGGRAEHPAVADDHETRIVFHLLQDDMAVAGELLDEIEGLLVDYRDRSRPLRIEVVAHSDGLALLRQRLSRHQERIAGLAAEYPNLAFVACRNTVQRLRVEKGVEVTLVPEAKLEDSGVTHVVKRQQQGWAYIKV